MPFSDVKLVTVAHLYGHDTPVWSVRWRPSTSCTQLVSCGGRRILLWEYDDPLQSWRLNSVICNAQESTTTKPSKVFSSQQSSIVSEEPNVCNVYAGLIKPSNDDVHSKSIRSVSWSTDGNLLAAASFDATASIWKEKLEEEIKKKNHEPFTTRYAWKVLTRIEGHENEVKQVAWNQDNRSIATCSRDRTIWIHTLIPNTMSNKVHHETQDCHNDNDDTFECVCSAVLTGHSQDIKCVVWHPCENLIVSASYDNTIRLWGPISKNNKTLHHSELIQNNNNDDDDDEDSMQGDWKCIQVLNEHQSTVWQVTFSPTGDEFASCSDDKTVRVWARKRNLKISSACNNTPISLSDENKALNIHDDDTNHQNINHVKERQPSFHAAHYWLMAFPMFRTLLLPTTPSSLIQHNQIHQQFVEETEREKQDSTTGVIESHSGIPEISVENTEKQQGEEEEEEEEYSKWKCTGIITNHHDRTIYSLAWHPQEDVIATACGDDGIRLFQRSQKIPCSFENNVNDVGEPNESWELIHSIPAAHAGDVNCVTWKPFPEDDGTWLLASGGDDHIVTVYKYYSSN